MGMDSELIRLLEVEAQAERERILGEARQQAEEILSRAREEAARLRAEHQKRLEEELSLARVRARSTATLQASSLILQAKDRAIEEVFRTAEEELQSLLRDREAYRGMLRSLLQEAIGGSSGHLIVEVAEQDEALAREIAAELALDAEIRTNEQVRHGVRVLSGGGRFVVENTLGSRLERAKPLLTAEIARILWG
ncbi:MAG: V-type ATP synthase subunit E [Armatimonadota bacterium]|nr:V-type ATP synthase subunit E [Armatimonadota bacterium]MDR5703979.1 V-type ATP synthase subunit E [Armatimonadota bacterium]MDR7434418.1 V-type ATP synthase subunit E [Armatimonadota bacterium]